MPFTIGMSTLVCVNVCVFVCLCVDVCWCVSYTCVFSFMCHAARAVRKETFEELF